MSIPPAVLAGIFQGSNMLFGFIGNRKQNKQYLQQLQTDRLLTQRNTKANTNSVLDQIEEATANNISAVSNANYDAFDSGSYKAIQKRLDDAGDKQLDNIELSNQLALNDIDNSLKNLADNMRMNELKLITDLGTTVFSTNKYMKDQRVLENYRTKQLEELAKIKAATKKNTSLMTSYYKTETNKANMRYRMGTLNFSVGRTRTR